MGTARAPNWGSGCCPACSASVSKPSDFGPGMGVSLEAAIVSTRCGALFPVAARPPTGKIPVTSRFDEERATAARSAAAAPGSYGVAAVCLRLFSLVLLPRRERDHLARSGARPRRESERAWPADQRLFPRVRAVSAAPGDAARPFRTEARQCGAAGDRGPGVACLRVVPVAAGAGHGTGDDRARRIG